LWKKLLGGGCITETSCSLGEIQAGLAWKSNKATDTYPPSLDQMGRHVFEEKGG
jgi:hypothetical protein